MSYDPFKPDANNPLTMQIIQRELENPYGDVSMEQYILHTIRVAIRTKTSDRGEVLDIRPIYEYPLIKRLYSRIGGTAEVIATWYNWREPSDMVTHRRVWKMTKHDIYKEVEKLQKQFRMKSRAGETVDIFAEVYGKNNVKGFTDKIRETHAAWIRVMKQARKKAKEEADAQGRPVGFVDLNDEAYQKIANTLLPRQESIEDVDIVPMETLTLDEGDSSLGALDSPFKVDPLFDALIGAGLDIKAANAVLELDAQGNLTESTLRASETMRSLSINDLETAIETWKQFKKGVPHGNALNSDGNTSTGTKSAGSNNG
jgi:hypothetical protein